MIKEVIGDYIIVALSAFFISVTLTPIVRKTCQRRKLLDFPTDPRRIHTIPTPRLGGVAVYFAFFLPLFAIFLTDGAVYELFIDHLDMLLSLYITSTLVFAVGVYDDIRGATVLQKFLVQIVAAVLIYFLEFKVTLISVPFVGSVSPGILGFPITILWIVGVTNALNFIDGIDGLACGVSFFSVSTMLILSLFLNHILTAFLAAALVGAIFGFALYNFSPASIFMGDSGSLFIGFIIAAISLHGSQKSSTAVILLIPVVALGVPITDTLLAIIRRLSNGHSPFEADREHIHHRLLRMGFSSRQVVLLLYVVCAILGITALLMTAVNNQMLALILITLSVMAIGGMKMLGYTTDVIEINTLARKRIEEKKRLFRQQRTADEILAEMKATPDMATLKKKIIRYFEIMELDVGIFFVIQHRSEGITPASEKTLPPRHPLSQSLGELQFSWHSIRYEERTIPVEHIWTIGVPLLLKNQKCGELFIGKHLNVSSSSSFLEITVIVENLKYTIEQTLSRMVQTGGF